MRTELINLYENRKDVTVKAYLLEDNVHLKEKQQLPAVIICPGGAYMYTSSREAEPIALRFNAMGYHAFVLDYSVYGGGTYPPQIDPSLPVREESLFPNAMKEIAMTFELIHQHADEWQVDIEKIGTIGFSAGGHNVAMYANSWNKAVIQDAVTLKGKALKPAFNIVGYPLTDFVYISENMTDQTYSPEAKAILISCFGTIDVTPEQLREYSPAHNVNTDTPPTFIWTTSEDTVVHPQDSLKLAIGLAHHQIPFEVHVFEKGPHGLSLANQLTAKDESQINSVAAQWTQAVEKWLENR